MNNFEKLQELHEKHSQKPIISEEENFGRTAICSVGVGAVACGHSLIETGSIPKGLALLGIGALTVAIATGLEAFERREIPEIE